MAEGVNKLRLLSILDNMSNMKHETYATGGAVYQDGPLKVSNCKHCHKRIVWATSKRTGGKYPVNVTDGYKGQQFYVKSDPHKCWGNDDALSQERDLQQLQDVFVERLLNGDDKLELLEWFEAEKAIILGGNHEE